MLRLDKTVPLWRWLTPLCSSLLPKRCPHLPQPVHVDQRTALGPPIDTPPWAAPRRAHLAFGEFLVDRSLTALKTRRSVLWLFAREIRLPEVQCFRHAPCI